MIICVCKRVSDRDIARCARAGMGFDDIQWELGVATQCGQCEPCARDTLTQCQASNRRAHCDNAVLRSATQPSHGVLDAATPGLHTLAIS